MCQLSDKDLRYAGTRNTTELMYNAFKDVFDSNQYRIDLDGLTLAYKYFMSSTLTIRLCGIAQINVRFNNTFIKTKNNGFSNLRIKLLYGMNSIQIVLILITTVTSMKISN